MFPYLSIAGFEIPTYGLMVALGILASIAYLKVACKRAGLSYTQEADAELALICGAVGCVIGAKLLYLLVSADQIARALESYSTLEVAWSLLSGGFVFYGGLIGAIVGVWAYARGARVSFDGLCAILVPIIPLFHCFGRIGCFLTGCCYGVEWKYGLVFARSEIAPNDVPLFPVQLVEAAAEAVIFLIIWRRSFSILDGVQSNGGAAADEDAYPIRRASGTATDSAGACAEGADVAFAGAVATQDWTVGEPHRTVLSGAGGAGVRLLCGFVFFYAPLRFVLEFLRGDAARGVFFGVSVSQVISVVMLVWAVWLWRRKARRQSCS